MTKKKTPQMDEMQQQIAELENKWKRAMADYQNLEKRIETQQANYIRLASVGLIDKLLPIIDDLERAASHVKNSGLEMILKQFYGVLESEGATKIEALGKEFNPILMDCVDMVEGSKNEVIKVVLEGYQMGEMVIRPAKVEVGNGETGKSGKKDIKNDVKNIN